MTTRLAIIPARGGSKRLPGKNVRDFCGRPMIGHILDAARRSDLFECIHVSTEDAAIAKIASDLGFAPDFSRPAELADDHTPLMPVLKHVLSTYEQRGRWFDEVWLLMACAPLVGPEDLKAAASLFASAGRSKPVLSVAPYSAPIEWAFERQSDGSLLALQPGKFAMRSQDLAPRFYDTGTFCIFPSQRVRESAGAGDDRGFLGFVLPRSKAVDIDNEEDWQLAELLHKKAGLNE